MAEERGFSVFINEYLAHIERKDAREGATKWVLLAAIAAIFWTAIGLIGKASMASLLALLSVLFVLFWLVEMFSSVFLTGAKSGGEARFFSRDFIRPAAAAHTAAILARVALTCALFAYVFFPLTSRDDTGRMAVWLVVVPLGVILIAGMAVLFEMRKPYSVSNPETPVIVLVMVLLFSVIPLIGLIVLNSVSGLIHPVFVGAGQVEVQLAVLICGFIFLVEKYTRNLIVDGESSAVRRVWRRLGLGEIDEFQARKDLELIIVGARLNDVISSEIDEFTRLADDVDDQVQVAMLEVDSLNSTGPLPRPVFDAIENSIGSRIRVIDDCRAKLESGYQKLVAKSKRMIMRPDSSDVKALERELGSRVNQVAAHRDKLCDAHKNIKYEAK